MTGSNCDIFISHAGLDKRKFADVLHHFMEAALRPAHITSFLDEKSLLASDKVAAVQMLEAAEEATIGVSLAEAWFCTAARIWKLL